MYICMCFSVFLEYLQKLISFCNASVAWTGYTWHMLWKAFCLETGVNGSIKRAEKGVIFRVKRSKIYEMERCWNRIHPNIPYEIEERLLDESGMFIHPCTTQIIKHS